MWSLLISHDGGGFFPLTVSKIGSNKISFKGKRRKPTLRQITNLVSVNNNFWHLYIFILWEEFKKKDSENITNVGSSNRWKEKEWDQMILLLALYTFINCQICWYDKTMELWREHFHILTQELLKASFKFFKCSFNWLDCI